jgi:SAM-dependent methyltransferase
MPAGRRRLASAGGIKSGRLLDIGCGCGHLLHEAKQLGFEVHGVEPSQDAVDYAAKHFGIDAVVCGAYVKDVFPEQHFDLISCIHVIDHVDSPCTLLEAACSHLKPGGCLVVATHNIESLLSRLTGEGFIAWSVQHISYYSPGTLKAMMERCGLTPLEVRRSITTYPLSHYVENGIRSPGVRGKLLKTLKTIGLGGMQLSFPFGNFEVFATRN